MSVISWMLYDCNKVIESVTAARVKYSEGQLALCKSEKKVSVRATKLSTMSQGRRAYEGRLRARELQRVQSQGQGDLVDDGLSIIIPRLRWALRIKNSPSSPDRPANLPPTAGPWLGLRHSAC